MIDKSWVSFEKELRKAMAGPPPITTRALYNELRRSDALAANITEEKIANWRRGRGHPQLASLRQVAESLGKLQHRQGSKNPIQLGHLLKEMGIVEEIDDAEIVHKALRVQKLDTKLRDSYLKAAALGRQAGASLIVQAAIRSGNWAVGVWPAYEGPDEATRMHVADRIDIVRTINASREQKWWYPLSDEDVWSDPIMKEALRSTHAIRIKAGPRIAGLLPDGYPKSIWSIPYLGSPRDAIIADPWPNLNGSVCFVSAATGNWAINVAAIVAIQIGYGFTSVRDLVMEIEGVTPSKASAMQHLRAHDQLVARPPHRRVWSYTGGLGEEPDEAAERAEHAASGTTTFVILREDDQLLNLIADQHPNIDRSALERRRSTLEKIAEMSDNRALTLEVNAQTSRQDRWNQALTHALASLQFLESTGRIKRSDVIHAAERPTSHDDRLIKPLNDWMRQHGWS